MKVDVRNHELVESVGGAVMFPKVVTGGEFVQAGLPSQLELGQHEDRLHRGVMFVVQHRNWVH